MDVFLWQTPTNVASSRVKEFESWLAESELLRAAQFKFERDRRRFIVRRAFLRWVLSRHLQMLPQEILFKEGQGQKPRVIDSRQEPIEFNLSHTGEIAVCGVTSGRAIGVDCEQIRELPNLQQMANTVMSDDELKGWSKLPDDSKLPCFFTVFSRKEAIGKAEGGGIASGLRTTGIPLQSFPPHQWVRILQPNHPHDWLLCDFFPNDLTKGSLALELRDDDHFSPRFNDYPVNAPGGVEPVSKQLPLTEMPEEFRLIVRRFL